ncbi:MAG TPA: hypothetical protein VLV86_23760, partial [Vicinamibacterales bacterium]|nr:hypothetical protein [Vicinamibacterales bacterium]
MPNALDVFREQQKAAGLVYERARQVSEMLAAVRQQLDGLMRNDELRELLRSEQRWLAEAQRTVSEVRAWREQERARFWPAMWRRWVVAVVFALAAAWAAGAGYAWATRPYASELAQIRSRVEFVESVERRILALTPA